MAADAGEGSGREMAERRERDSRRRESLHALRKKKGNEWLAIAVPKDKVHCVTPICV